MEQYEFVEIFSGKAEVTKVMFDSQISWKDGVIVHMIYSRSESGYSCARYDRDYNKSAMDINSAAGFVFLACVNPTPYPYTWYPVLSPLLRLALILALQLPINGLLLMAPDCSSWGLPARGTSKRSYINVYGRSALKWVRDSGTMVSRSLSCMGQLDSGHPKRNPKSQISQS